MATRSILRHGGHTGAAATAAAASMVDGALGDGAEIAASDSSAGPSALTARSVSSLGAELIEYWQSSSHEAFVTRALGIALRLRLLEDEAGLSLWSQGVSLLLTGVMIFSSVRSFLVQASRFSVRIEVLAQRRAEKVLSRRLSNSARVRWLLCSRPAFEAFVWHRWQRSVSGVPHNAPADIRPSVRSPPWRLRTWRRMAAAVAAAVAERRRLLKIWLDAPRLC